MPSTYDSTFWFQRAQETHALSEQMRDEGARGGMIRLARKYERIALQSACDEARIAFESANEALRVSQDTASPEQIASITKTVDAVREEMHKARRAMEVFRRVHLLIVDGVEVLDDGDAATSAR